MLCTYPETIYQSGGGVGGGGTAGRKRSLWETLLFLKYQVFGGKLGKEAEPMLLMLMTQCSFKVRKKVGLKTNDLL
jgi:hypothetical protein